MTPCGAFWTRHCLMANRMPGRRPGACVRRPGRGGTRTAGCGEVRIAGRGEAATRGRRGGSRLLQCRIVDVGGQLRPEALG